jgi:hypothetical protein
LQAEQNMTTFVAGLITGIVATLAALAIALQLPVRQPRSNDPEA